MLASVWVYFHGIFNAILFLLCHYAPYFSYVNICLEPSKKVLCFKKHLKLCFRISFENHSLKCEILLKTYKYHICLLLTVFKIFFVNQKHVVLHLIRSSPKHLKNTYDKHIFFFVFSKHMKNMIQFCLCRSELYTTI